MKENERWTSSGGLATSLASPGREARAFRSDRKAWGERRLNARGVQDQPAGAAADRTVALVAKVPKSGRSCNTLRDSLEAGPPTEEKGYLPLSLQARDLRSSFRLGFNSGLVAEAIDFSRRGGEERKGRGGDISSIKKGAGGDDEMKRISRVARRTRRKDLVNNNRSMSSLLLSNGKETDILQLSASLLRLKQALVTTVKQISAGGE
ncbi:hypothetical protein ALC56_01486 [Trachymyrmex septentrionalis]|uniref:Uncharacterized protein n=1 Tax=Trachymyrmex septentrionalis TaxID=34720 RepID=A0A195FU12_9HYME|nr:hypothetical protein ALC56_01486 [Trachymyrmex septentrionalis]